MLFGSRFANSDVFSWILEIWYNCFFHCSFVYNLNVPIKTTNFLRSNYYKTMQHRSNTFQKCFPPNKFINRGKNIWSDWRNCPSARQIIYTNIICHQLKYMYDRQWSRNTVNNFISNKNGNANDCCYPNCHFMTSRS